MGAGWLQLQVVGSSNTASAAREWRLQQRRGQGQGTPVPDTLQRLQCRPAAQRGLEAAAARCTRKQQQQNVINEHLKREPWCRCASRWAPGLMLDACQAQAQGQGLTSPDPCCAGPAAGHPARGCHCVPCRHQPQESWCASELTTHSGAALEGQPGRRPVGGHLTCAVHMRCAGPP